MAGRRVYLSEKELRLILEGLDMLESDWSAGEGDHPELNALTLLEIKLLRASN